MSIHRHSLKCFKCGREYMKNMKSSTWRYTFRKLINGFSIVRVLMKRNEPMRRIWSSSRRYVNLRRNMNGSPRVYLRNHVSKRKSISSLYFKFSAGEMEGNLWRWNCIEWLSIKMSVFRNILFLDARLGLKLLFDSFLDTFLFSFFFFFILTKKKKF